MYFRPLKKFCEKAKKYFTNERKSIIITESQVGGIAQLGERLNGIQEVSGSIPLISTKKALKS